MDKLEQLLNIFEKKAGDVIQFKPKKLHYDDIDEFEQVIRSKDISKRKREVIDATKYTAALESETNGFYLDKQAFDDLESFLINWAHKWIS